MHKSKSSHLNGCALTLAASNIARTQLAFQIASPTMDLPAARQAAAQLDERLSPIVLDHFAPQPSLPRVQLLKPPASPTFQLWPQALFQLQPRLGVAALPPNWIPAYLDWAARLNRSRQIARARVRMAKAIEHRIDENTDITVDPIVAGLLLFEFSPTPETELRGTLMKMALAQPLGGYLCAQALHTASERKAILEAVVGDSLAVHGISQLPEFANTCLCLARSRPDLASGLVIARLGSDDEFADWLRQTGLAGFKDGAAACAMLVLNPNASENLQEGWLTTLRNSNNDSHALSTVHWTRHTWAPPKWAALRDTLKSWAIHQGQCHFFNWFAQVEPECAAAGLEMAVDPLWSFELIQALNLDDEALRFRLADQLGRLTYHLPSSLVLNALNLRKDRSLQGGW